jgi:hypothetical protein
VPFPNEQAAPKWVYLAVMRLNPRGPGKALLGCQPDQLSLAAVSSAEGSGLFFSQHPVSPSWHLPRWTYAQCVRPEGPEFETDPEVPVSVAFIARRSVWDDATPRQRQRTGAR